MHELLLSCGKFEITVEDEYTCVYKFGCVCCLRKIVHERLTGHPMHKPSVKCMPDCYLSHGISLIIILRGGV